MNPRAAINDLHPFQGCPFDLLGTSPNEVETFKNINQPQIKSYLLFATGEKVSPAERVGFEPTRPFGQTVFKTASL